MRLLPAVAITFTVTMILVCTWSALIFALTESGLVSQGVALAIGLPTLMLVALAGSIVAMGFAYTRFSSRLNAAFAPLGIQRSRWLFNISHYQGVFEGRQVKVGFMENRMANLSLHISVEAPLLTRMMLGTKTAFVTALITRHARDMHTLPLAAPDFAHLSGAAHDERWANALLDTPEARQALLRITRETSASDIRLIVISPVGIKLMLQNIRMQEISAQSMEAWINDLLAVVRSAERLLSPGERLTPTAWDQTLFSDESRETILRMIIFVVCMTAICLCGTIMFGLALASLK